MDKSQEDYEKKYNELSAKFWALQKLENTEEEKAYDKNLEELNRIAKSWREQLRKLEMEAIELANKVEDFDAIKEKYDFLQNRYKMLKELDNCL